ncbi:MAG: nicotinate-nucleotide diphosphorylase (carboxylating) [Firmicutes bacterium HGW-Firmicutes-1]|jgi:nicotinate-nucleotide pyrophosphorylase (carboxylating)|nr:MAG: nicotinate-nucleotide diphosphorylase (carboxylating) [Firmicutes bacterium HGW-Firmicutes-1]
MNWLNIDELLIKAINEDALYGDITTSSIVDKNSKSSVDLIVKEEGIIAGLDVFKRVFELLGDVEVETHVKDGDKVSPSQVIGKLRGSTHNILVGERLALNLIQRMSGIATTTNKLVELVKDTNTKVLDTRKTTPNLRMLEKYAVKVGGGSNHRYNLSDGVLIKDNHIGAAGGIKNAVDKVRAQVSFVRKIEVETESLEQVQEALDAGADIIMLDNMTTNIMKQAVELIGKRALTEASGNVNSSNIKEIADTGVDFISIGMLTHSVSSLDISMKNLVIE